MALLVALGVIGIFAMALYIGAAGLFGPIGGLLIVILVIVEACKETPEQKMVREAIERSNEKLYGRKHL
ncbi:hypothetical protein CE91St46_09670 [Eubacteriales bacterium]|nr:hypothetical protein [Faecalicatena sp. BF-R-105]GKH49856.1 hypothetical protein CE91St46_09670 [Eubacteriales bacterium]GKH62492.1 hypothetical protein CE91St47_09610 [Eubacteriales bacterium]